MQIKKTLNLLSIVALAALTIGLAACDNHVKEVEDNVQTVLDEAEVYVEQAKIPYKPEPIDTVTMKEDIWLGQDSFKIAGGEPFPLALEAPDALTVSFSEPIKLVDLVADFCRLRNICIYNPQEEFSYNFCFCRSYSPSSFPPSGKTFSSTQGRACIFFLISGKAFVQ